ncbi:hypothetical protein BDP27DRAFT_1372253 [Rhodocollybia butyracea]|uniref:Uncharacterized protein n=1 Tax=Rhodocollybia butyracea TaxID=206335 RepID=A0A9P5TYU1_9AGAR|nr:hypothetical protein BDP27DRAFT_1372253 [Rhodocollybia butyracea]
MDSESKLDPGQKESETTSSNSPGQTEVEVPDIGEKQCPIRGYDLAATLLRPPSCTPTILELEEIEDVQEIYQSLREQGINVRDYSFNPINTGGPVGSDSSDKEGL